MLFCFLKYSLKQPFFLKQSLYLKRNCATFINRDVTSAREFALPKRPPLPRIFPCLSASGRLPDSRGNERRARSQPCHFLSRNLYRMHKNIIREKRHDHPKQSDRCPAGRTTAPDYCPQGCCQTHLWTGERQNDGKSGQPRHRPARTFQSRKRNIVSQKTLY